MKIISYWRNCKNEEGVEPTPFYVNTTGEPTAYIVGVYAQDGQNPIHAMGIYYTKGFPYVHSVISPLVIPHEEAILLLEGLLKSLIQKALIEEEIEEIEKKEEKSDSPEKESASAKAAKVAEALAFLLKQ